MIYISSMNQTKGVLRERRRCAISSCLQLFDNLAPLSRIKLASAAMQPSPATPIQPCASTRVTIKILSATTPIVSYPHSPQMQFISP